MPRLLTVAFVALALVLAACGETDEPERTAPAGDGFPVTVQTKPGEVTIPSAPKRVVALDFPSADAALAAGIVPVGMANVSYVDGGVQAWTEAALAGARPKLLRTDAGFPFEKIAALRPDVILATNTYPLIADSYEQLSAIAPVVGHVEAPGVDTWQQDARLIARALGRAEEGGEAVAAAEAELRRARDAHPEFRGQTVSFFNYVAGDGLYVIDDDRDVSIRFLKELGFRGVSAEVDALKGTSGRAQVSEERYDVLDAGVVMGTSPDSRALAGLERSRLFADVPAVRRGGFVSLEIGPATAMAFPSVLSVPYAVDGLVPRLARATT